MFHCSVCTSVRSPARGGYQANVSCVSRVKEDILGRVDRAYSDACCLLLHVDYSIETVQVSSKVGIHSKRLWLQSWSSGGVETRRQGVRY